MLPQFKLIKSVFEMLIWSLQAEFNGLYVYLLNLHKALGVILATYAPNPADPTFSDIRLVLLIETDSPAYRSAVLIREFEILGQF